MPNSSRERQTTRRPKLADISLHRDIYGEVSADLGVDPLPVYVPRSDFADRLALALAADWPFRPATNPLRLRVAR